MNKLCAALVCCLLSVISSEASAQSPTAGDDLILVRQTDKSPDAAVEAIRTYVENRKCVYLGANKVKPPQGEVIFVKVCVPEVGKCFLRHRDPPAGMPALRSDSGPVTQAKILRERV
jgi:hypothetical protein